QKIRAHVGNVFKTLYQPRNVARVKGLFPVFAEKASRCHCKGWVQIDQVPGTDKPESAREITCDKLRMLEQRGASAQVRSRKIYTLLCPDGNVEFAFDIRPEDAVETVAVQI